MNIEYHFSVDNNDLLITGTHRIDEDTYEKVARITDACLKETDRSILAQCLNRVFKEIKKCMIFNLAEQERAKYK